jgi:DoxX-like family
VVELLGAIGLILPAALDIAPVLTPMAATGLAILMALAMNTHHRRREPVLLLVVVVAWGHFGPYSF